MDVEAWLGDLGLGQFAESFAENGVDGDLLLELSNEDLKDLGLTRLADRKRVLKAIAGLSDGKGPEAPDPPATPEAERRQVTVLFADLSGYSELSNELGAEETLGLLNRYFDRVDRTIEDYGGTIDKHMGDNVMALFGAPLAHVNDPERAVRAATAIHAGMEALSRELGREIKTHIGIASGPVVASGTGSQAHHEYTVTGKSVNLASRLQDKAASGETLVSASVHRAVGDLIRWKALGKIDVKGFERPVAIWRIDGLGREGGAGHRGSFVGRQAELAQLGSLIEPCVNSGQGRAVVIRGEAGIGKSRLVEEIARTAGDRGFAACRCLVLDFGGGLEVISGLVRSLLDVPAQCVEAERSAAARAAVREGLIDPDQRVFLNNLLDLPQPLDLRSRYDAMDDGTRNGARQATVARLLVRCCERQPILVAVEDIHWADRPTLAHLANLASTVATTRAILVMTSRVEGDPLTQGWRAWVKGSALTTIDLGPLRESDALEIARGFGKAAGPLLESCLERAEGNPLFLEQLSCAISRKVTATTFRTPSKAWSRRAWTVSSRATRKPCRRPRPSASDSRSTP